MSGFLFNTTSNAAECEKVGQPCPPGDNDDGNVSNPEDQVSHIFKFSGW